MIFGGFLGTFWIVFDTVLDDFWEVLFGFGGYLCRLYDSDRIFFDRFPHHTLLFLSRRGPGQAGV